MTTAVKPADWEARRRIETCLDENLFVEAAAGTGKTTAMVGRIAELLRTGRATMESVVAVTFTEKAAAEMRLKLMQRLEELAAAEGAPSGEPLPPDKLSRVEQALRSFERAQVKTLHAFCTDLLRTYPLEAGLDPDFQVASSSVLDRLAGQALDELLAGSSENPKVARVLRRVFRREFHWESGVRGSLVAAIRLLAENGDFTAPWSRPRGWNRRAELDRAVQALVDLDARTVVDAAGDEDNYLIRNYAEIAICVEDLMGREQDGERDYDYVERWLKAVLDRRTGWGWHGKGRFVGGFSTDELRERRAAARQAAKAVADRADADLAADLRQLLLPVVDRFHQLKRAGGWVSYQDMLVRTRDLLRGQPEVLRRSRNNYSHVFIDEFQDTDRLQVEILLLLCGADEPSGSAGPGPLSDLALVPGKLFVVGDPKQSIYRFRRADVRLYERIRRELGCTVLELTTSFRSRPMLQAAVNGAFSKRMTGSSDGTQATYVPLAPHRPEIPDMPAVLALPVPEPYDRGGGVASWAIAASAPAAVGQFIRWLLEDSGWKVSDPSGGGLVPVEARHVCILSRRFQSWGRDIMRPYAEALEKEGIQHLLVGGPSLFEREEVVALWNCLAAMEWPGDRLKVYAALRGPLFALGDHNLFEYSRRLGPLHPWADPPADISGARQDLQDAAAALSILRELGNNRNDVPVWRTIHELLSRLRAHAGIAWRKEGGDMALANVLRVADRAREFERDRAGSFRGFLTWMREEAERGEPVPGVLPEGEVGVRVMTVHKAKGLEFPVVVLADPGCRVSRNPRRFVDPDVRGGLWAEQICGCRPSDVLDNSEEEIAREHAEADRVAYVAATRARDLLVIPAVGDPPSSGFKTPVNYRDEDPGWMDALHDAVYPEGPAGEQRPRPPPGLPRTAVGADTVAFRPDRWAANYGRPRKETVKTGLYESRAGSEVVWWQRPEPAGTGPSGADSSGEGETEEGAGNDVNWPGALQLWQAERAGATEKGSQSSFTSVTVREVAGVHPEPSANGSGAGADAFAVSAGGRPEWHRMEHDLEFRARVAEVRGREFGDLVHAVLRDLPLMPPDQPCEEGETVRDLATVLARAAARRTLFPDNAELVETAAELAVRALRHPLLRRAATARAGGGTVRREIELLDRSGLAAEINEPMREGQTPPAVLRGTADLAFHEPGPDGGSWTVVDYKTDLDPEPHRAGYEAQVSLYAEMIRRATGLPATAAVLVL